MTEQYHRVFARIWENADFRAYTNDARLAALYALTCSHRNTEGLFRLPITYAAYDLLWPVERAEQAFDDLESGGFLARDKATDYVWLVNALKWNLPVGPKQVAGAANRVGGAPDTELRARFLLEARAICPKLADDLQTRYAWSDTPSIQYRYTSDSSSSSSSSNSSSNSNSATTPRARPKSDPTELAAAAVALGDTLLERIGYVDAQAGPDITQYVERALARGWPPSNLEDAATEIGAIPHAEIEKSPRHVLLGCLRKRANEDPPPEIAHQADGTSLDLSLDFHDLTGLPDDPDAEIAARYAEENAP